MSYLKCLLVTSHQDQTLHSVPRCPPVPASEDQVVGTWSVESSCLPNKSIRRASCLWLVVAVLLRGCWCELELKSVSWKDTTKQNYVAFNILTGGGGRMVQCHWDVTFLSLNRRLQSSIISSVVKAISPPLWRIWISYSWTEEKRAPGCGVAINI